MRACKRRTAGTTIERARNEKTAFAAFGIPASTTIFMLWTLLLPHVKVGPRLRIHRLCRLHRLHLYFILVVGREGSVRLRWNASGARLDTLLRYRAADLTSRLLPLCLCFDVIREAVITHKVTTTNSFALHTIQNPHAEPSATSGRQSLRQLVTALVTKCWQQPHHRQSQPQHSPWEQARSQKQRQQQLA